jgi:hypothetical protein
MKRVSFGRVGAMSRLECLLPSFCWAEALHVLGLWCSCWRTGNPVSFLHARQTHHKPKRASLDRVGMGAESLLLLFLGLGHALNWVLVMEIWAVDICAVGVPAGNGKRGEHEQSTS